jgi:hypothetical protein
VTLDLEFVALMMGVMIGHDRQFKRHQGDSPAAPYDVGVFEDPRPQCLE